MARPRGAEKGEEGGGEGGEGGFDIEAAVADPVAALIHSGPRGVKDRLEDLLAVNDTRGINKHV